MKLSEENLVGKVFNRWEVIRFSHKVGYNKYFVCKCLDCNKERTLYIQNVISGKSKSCGCKSKVETAYKINKKYNEYEVLNDTVKVYVDNDNERVMLCDLDDWKTLKRHYWRENADGYAIAINNYETIRFHRYVLGLTNPKIQVDHINGNV